MLTIGYSSLKTFKRCRRQYYYSYVLGLEKEKSITGALSIGTIVHSCLENIYLGTIKNWDGVIDHIADVLNPDTNPEVTDTADMILGMIKA